MAEVILPPDSEMVSKSLLQLTFRKKYRLNVIGLRRGQHAFTGNLRKEKLRSGDTLLVIGPWKAIRQLQTQRVDFLVLSLPAEVDKVAPAASQAPYALPPCCDRNDGYRGRSECNRSVGRVPFDGTLPVHRSWERV